jgi:hypothetical protein
MIKNLEALYSGRRTKPKGNGINAGLCEATEILQLSLCRSLLAAGLCNSLALTSAELGHYFCGIQFFKHANG